MTNSPIRITAKTNPRIKDLAKRKLSPSSSFFLIESKHLCDMAFEAGCLMETYALEDPHYEGVPCTLVGEEVLQKLAFSSTPSGIVGVAKQPDLPDVNFPKILFLDRVQDPGNVGTLLRTALAFDYHQVVFASGTASPFSPKVIAASQGAIFKLRIEEAKDPLSYINKKKGEGYLIYGSALRNATPLKSLPKNDKPFVLMVGNEGQGIDAKLLDLSSTNIKIEMDDIESLNVGVAGGILMYLL